MDAMGGSNEERQALNTALADSDRRSRSARATALARQHVADPAVVARLAVALSATPQRTVMALGNTGLSGSAPGWQLQTSDNVAEGLLRAKALPPKDVIVVQDGLQGVTLDTMVFSLKNDPRTASVPLIVVTKDVEATAKLYGDKVTKVAATASFADVAAVAGERSEPQQEALDRARRAADALATLAGRRGPRRLRRHGHRRQERRRRHPARRRPERLRPGRRSSTSCPPSRSCCSTRPRRPTCASPPCTPPPVSGPPTAARRPTRKRSAPPLLALVDGTDATLALPAAEALGQLRGVKDAAVCRCGAVGLEDAPAPAERHRGVRLMSPVRGGGVSLRAPRFAGPGSHGALPRAVIRGSDRHAQAPATAAHVETPAGCRPRCRSAGGRHVPMPPRGRSVCCLAHATLARCAVVVACAARGECGQSVPRGDAGRVHGARCVGVLARRGGAQSPAAIGARGVPE